MGELHLEILVDRMRREFKVVANVGAARGRLPRDGHRHGPKVDYRHVKQTGGRGQFAHVVLDIEPNPGGGFEFVDKITGGVIPKEYIPSVDARRPGALNQGTLAGYPVIDLKGQPGLRLVPRRRLVADGLRDRRLRRRPGSHPQGQAGPPRADHGRRGGHPRGLHRRRRGRPVGPPGPGRGHRHPGQRPGGGRLVPLAEMFGYATDVRSRTQGRAAYTMQFATYEPAPNNVAEEVIAVRAKRSTRAS